MCVFITAAVPLEVDLRSLRALLDEFGMSFAEIKNSSVEPFIDGCHYVQATRTSCDCDTALGCASYLHDDEEKSQEYFKDISKLRKKGWSQHKIDRWLEEKSDAAEKSIEEKKSKYESDAASWCRFIPKLLSAGNMKRVGLLHHMYNGNLHTEKITIRAVEQLSVSANLKEELMRMDQDVLYWITRQ